MGRAEVSYVEGGRAGGRAAGRPGALAAAGAVVAAALVWLSLVDRHPVAIADAAAESRARVLVIGLDGATWDLVRPWIEDGSLPNLRALVEGGASAPLRTVFPASSLPAWTSAVTGVNPGQHGIFGFLRPIDGSGRSGFVTASDRRVVPLWTRLSRAGRRVAIVNVPGTTPPDRVNGVMIGGFPHPADGPRTWPEAALSGHPEYRYEGFADLPRPGEEEAWLEDLEAAEATRLALAHRLLEQGGWDLFFVVLTGTDRVQHHLWRFQDPRHPHHDPLRAATLGRAIHDYHVMADAAVGELVRAAGPGAVTVVLSDHGFGPVHRVISGEALMAALNPGRGPGRLPDVYLHNFFGGQVYVARRGREPFGRLPPGPDLEARRAGVESFLRTLVDAETGVPLVSEIHGREEVYHGEAAELGPDFVFRETEGYLVAPFDAEGLTGTLPEDYFSGFHRPVGILIASGPGVKEGAALPEASILDVAPTLLHLLGEPVPDYMEGRVLSGALAGEAAERPVRRVSEPRGAWHERAVADGSGPEVEEQLRALGYLR